MILTGKISLEHLLVHELVEPLLQKRSESTSGPGRQPVSASPRLKGKHFPISRHPKRGRCTVCSHEKSNATGKEKGAKTSNYCQKCEKFICKACFEKFHTQSLL